MIQPDPPPPPSPAREWILASASPRRSELLREAGWNFRVVVPDFDEAGAIRKMEHTAEKPDSASIASQLQRVARLVNTLAEGKARAAVDLLPDSTPAGIIAADTVIFLPGRGILGKPEDESDARDMLRALSGTYHFALTGHAMIRLPGPQIQTQLAVTRVVFRELSDDDIEAYLASGEWEGKAGAYGIQGVAGAFVQSLDGERDTVIGLSISTLNELRNQPGE